MMVGGKYEKIAASKIMDVRHQKPTVYALLAAFSVAYSETR